MEIDYNKIWQESHCFALSAQDKEKTKNMSKKEAASYAASAHIWEDGKRRSQGIKITPDETVLEIGSGPGILSFDLAARAKHLTAIEPALGMIELFKDEAKKRNIRHQLLKREGNSIKQPQKLHSYPERIIRGRIPDRSLRKADRKIIQR